MKFNLRETADFLVGLAAVVSVVIIPILFMGVVFGLGAWTFCLIAPFC